MSRKSHTRASRRDRRKAKQSEFAREGTTNPRKKGHHVYEPRSAAAAEPTPTVAARVCRKDARLHTFKLFPDMGVKVCSGCGLRQKMDEAEFAREGNRILIPEAVQRKLVKPAAERKTRAEPEPAPPPTPSCRSGEHDLKHDPQLGIRVCRQCSFFTK